MELSNDEGKENREKSIQEIESIILGIDDPDMVNELNSLKQSMTSKLWDKYLCLAFKYLEHDDLKSHYHVSNILISTVNTIYPGNDLKLAYSKFHYAKSLKDYESNYSQSLLEFQEAITLIEKEEKKDSRIYTQARFFLGSLYDDMGKSEESIAILTDVLDKQINMYTEYHIFTARTYNCLGIAEDNRGNLKTACEHYQKAYNILSLISDGSQNIDCAKVLNNLAGIYFKWEDYTRSAKFYHKVLEIYLQVYDDRCSYVGITYNNLGNCYTFLNNYEYALLYLKKGLDVMINTLGMKHPQTAMTCKNLGDLYMAMGNEKSALEMYSNCIDVLKEKFGEDHDLFIFTLAKIKKLKLQ